MSAISLKSITGITSITTPAGVDNQLTLHNNNTTEAVKLDIAGNLHFHNHLNITGISTAANFKTGTSNLHSTGLNVFDLDVDGHTELDNVNIVGVTTHNGTTNLYGNGGASVVWGNTGYTGHLSFDGSNNAVIRAASGKALIFQTNHVNERLRITSDGKIGINEQSPQSLLDIHDSAAANDTPEIRIESFRPTIRFADRSSSQADSEICGDDGIQFRISEESDNDTALTERFRITSEGRVGINESSPDSILSVMNPTNLGSTAGNLQEILRLEGHVANDGILDFKQVRLASGNQWTTSAFRIQRRIDATNMGYIDFGSGGGGSGRDILFASGNGKLYMHLDNTGNVGVGTDDPKTKLNVYTHPHSDTGGILVQNANYSSNVDKAYLIAGTQNWTGAATDWNTYGFQHKLKTDSSGIPRLTIDASAGSSNLIEIISFSNQGKVGIGTDNPDEQLHVYNGAGNVTSFVEAIAGDALLNLSNSGNGNYSGINFIRERGSGQTGRNGGSIFMPSNTANNEAFLYIQAQSTSAHAGVTGSLSANNGVRLKLHGDDGIFSLETGADERLRITSTGEVLINESTARSYVDGAGNTQTPKLQVEADDNTSSAISLTWNSGGGSAGRRASFMFARTADGSAVSNNSVLGEVLFMGEGNSTLEKAASIRAEVDGTPGTNDMPGRLIFSTSADGSDSPGERLRINSNGGVSIGSVTGDHRLTVRKDSTITNFTVDNDPAEASGMAIQNYSFSVGRYSALSFHACNSSSVQVASILGVSVASGTAADLRFTVRDSNTSTAEVMRMSGADKAFLVGTNHHRTAEFSHPDGFSIRGDTSKGQFQNTVTSVMGGLMNRDGSDGAILGFRREGVGVGHIGVDASTFYLNFGGTTATAHQLDDYEEGDHNTTVTMSGDTNFSYVNRTLAYTKIGRLVHVTGRLYLGGCGGSTFSFTLPFTCASGVKYETSNEFQNIRFNDGYTFRISDGTAEARIQSDGSNTGIGVANPHLNVNLTYFTAT